MRDIVGLYLNPPDHALVLCVDEKSQIQALNRTQPVLPMGLVGTKIAPPETDVLWMAESYLLGRLVAFLERSIFHYSA